MRVPPHGDGAAALTALPVRLPLSAADVAPQNDLRRRTGRVAATMGEATLVLSSPPPDARQAGTDWWTVRAGGACIALGLSGPLRMLPPSLPGDLGLETMADPALDAMERHLGTAVDVRRASGPTDLPFLRTFAAEWDGTAGALAVAWDAGGARLIADLLRAAPVPAPGPRRLSLRPAIEVGRFDLPPGHPAPRPGEVLLPRAEELTGTEGRLMLGGRAVATVRLHADGAEIRSRLDTGAETLVPDDGLRFHLPCGAMPREAALRLPPGERIAFAQGAPGEVDILRRGRRVGRGVLVRLGARLGVEVRVWRRLPRPAARHPAGEVPRIAGRPVRTRQDAERSA